RFKPGSPRKSIIVTTFYLIKNQVGILHYAQADFVVNFFCGNSREVHLNKETFDLLVRSVTCPDKSEISEGCSTNPTLVAVNDPSVCDLSGSCLHPPGYIGPMVWLSHGKTADGLKIAQLV